MKRSKSRPQMLWSKSQDDPALLDTSHPVDSSYGRRPGHMDGRRK